jgi:hypothetical protein
VDVLDFPCNVRDVSGLFALSVGNAGWLRVDLGECVAYLRLTPGSRGRWVARELVIDASEGDPLTTAMLSTVPLASIEAFVNTDVPTREYLAASFQNVSAVGGPATGSNIAVLASHFATLLGTRINPASNWAAAAQASLLHGAQRVRKQQPPPSVPRDTSYRLKPPSGGLTDEFLTTVARAYAAAVARGEPPNRTLHVDAGFDPTREPRTVERWVYLARKRGIMPPARKGSRG